jgi:nucleoside-diphosphate-sugar epimerase
VAGYGGALHELDGPPGPLRATIGHPRSEPDPTGPAAYPYPDGCGSWQQADVRTARDRLGWRPRINLEESLADIWMEAACRI